MKTQFLSENVTPYSDIHHAVHVQADLEISYRLNFSKHISELCRKAASSINALKRLKNTLVTMIGSWLATPTFYHTLTTATWFGTFVEKAILTKSKRSTK